MQTPLVLAALAAGGLAAAGAHAQAPTSRATGQPATMHRDAAPNPAPPAAGRRTIAPAPGADVAKTPVPGGPVPIPYPNVGAAPRKDDTGVKVSPSRDGK